MGSENLLLHANWGHELPMENALTPSPSPVRRERVAVRPGEGWFMGRFNLLLRVNWLP